MNQHAVFLALFIVVVIPLILAGIVVLFDQVILPLMEKDDHPNDDPYGDVEYGDDDEGDGGDRLMW